MAVGPFTEAGDGKAKAYPGKLTPFILFTTLVASTAGLIFGYDIGISGGVTSMESFLRKFFPSIYMKMVSNQSTDKYCKFDSQLLTTFTSSLYLAGLVSCLFASTTTRLLGRKWSMLAGGFTFVVGSALNGGAENVAVLIIGRILLGVGIGLATQSAPLYVSETAPYRLRGTLNINIQLMITVGIFAANLVNYGTAKISGDWSWRISLALAAVPAIVVTIGSIFLPDSPNSLIARGQDDKAMMVLRKFRGTDDVHEEFKDMVTAGEVSRSVEHPWADIVKRKYRPHLVMALLLPSLQQLTGINAIMFYAPVLFKTIGFETNASLMSAVITGLINVLATFVSIFTVDRWGRRKLFLEGGPQMFISQIAVGTLIAVKFTGEDEMPKVYAGITVAFICIYVAGFAWSWGPMLSLVPSEIFPLEIRPAGQSITIAVNMLFTFLIAQAFLPMLCHLKFGLFYFFAGWVAVATAFVHFFLPETKGVPIEQMMVVWKDHWFWAKFVSDATEAKESVVV